MYPLVYISNNNYILYMSINNARYFHKLFYKTLEIVDS